MFLKSIFSVLVVIFIMIFGLSNRIQKKVDKVVKTTFEVEAFKMEPKIFQQEIITELPSEFSEDTFFKIENNENLIGYAYISKAPSKTDEFDYLILFDSELIIRASKVLAYREDYGGEIGSKRWLKQFKGKTSSDELVYGSNISAISGATISVKSMTNAVNNVLKSIKVLQHKDQL